MAFAKNTIAGMLAWYLSNTTGTTGPTNNGIYTDAGITLATNGQTVQQWNDQSGNGRNLTQATGALQPTYNTSALNGTGGVVFNGTLGQFLKNTAVSFGSQSATVFILFSNTARGLGSNVIGGAQFLVLGSNTSANVAAGSTSFYESMPDDGLTGLLTLNLSATAATAYLTYGTASAPWFDVSDVEAAASSVTNTGVTLGAGYNGVAVAGNNITVNEVLVYNTSLSMANMQTVWSYAKGKLLTPQAILSTTPVIVGVGDSGMVGPYLTANTQEFMLQGAATYLTNTNTLLRNYAIGGASFPTITSNAMPYVNTIPAVSLTQPSLLVISCGHNDLFGGASVATVFASLQTLVNSAIAAGWNKIMVATLTPWLNPPIYETARQQYNSLVRAAYGKVGNSYPVPQVIIGDVGADPLIGYNGAQLTSYYASDYTHLSQSGNVVAGTYLKAALYQAFGFANASFANGTTVTETFYGIGTLWSGSPFSWVSGNGQIANQTVNSQTNASITFTLYGNGPFVITDGFLFYEFSLSSNTLVLYPGIPNR